MKKLFFALFLTIHGVGHVQAQNISTDGNTGQMIAPVDSQLVNGLDSTYITRIAFDVKFNNNLVEVYWHLQYCVVQDSTSIYYYDAISDYFTLPVIEAATIGQSKMGICLYAQQHAVHNKRKVKFTYSN